ncbi:MAG: SPOR domain-containing protein [Flavobacteriales bacterium]|nr:SPOR domain-containing protein [Flavobacteriales bacterium]
MGKHLLFLSAFLAPYPIWAQEPIVPLDTPSTEGVVQVLPNQVGRQTPGELIVNVPDQLAAFLRSVPELERVQHGFRVQIFLGSKVEATKLRAQFLQAHPDIPAYLSYMAPNFRLRVGDSRDRVGAERLRQELRVEHPGCYVVPDRIEMPRLPEE